jgi:aspartate racemase
MKMLGLIGGMSWESTAIYYRNLNQIARERLGGLSSAQLLLWSVEFASIAKLQADGEWDKLTAIMVDAARRLEKAGAEALLICANTMHKMAPEVEAAVSVPLIHIADVAANEVKRAGCARPLLLATRFVMEEDFYKSRLQARHGIEAIIPPEADRLALHRMIFQELCQGIVSPASKTEFFGIIASARKDYGIDGVILGCTEFGLLAGQDDLDIPVFDTAALHAKAAMDFVLNTEGALQ